MARLNKSQLENLKKKYGVDRIWSYSRISTYKNLNGWEYYLKYILKHKINTENIWTYLGTYSHDVAQDCIEGDYPESEMLAKFDEAIFKWQTERPDLEFPSESIQNGYIKNMRSYFANTNYDDINNSRGKTIEMPVKIVLKRSNGDNIVFVGYIDLLYRDGDTFYIVDFKTSSKGSFSGAKLADSSMQLKLYALGIHQMHQVPYEDIVLRYDLQKYVKVSFLQENGKWSKPTLLERREWITKQANRITKILEKNDIDMFTAQDMITEAVEADSLSVLPDYVQERFSVTKGYLDIEMNDDIAKETEQEIVDTIEEILMREQADDLEKEFPEPILEQESFYLYNLAPALLEYHKEYQDKQALKEALEDIDDGSVDALFM